MLRARNLGTAGTGTARRPSRQYERTGARDQHQQVLDITLATRGPDHPDTAPFRGSEMDMAPPQVCTAHAADSGREGASSSAALCAAAPS